MKKITNVSFLLGRNSEYYLMCQNMSSQITAEFAEKFKITQVYQPYVELVNRVKDVYLQNQQFANTKALNEAEALSNSYFSTFKSMLSSYKNWPDAEKQTAYESIYYVAKPYWKAYAKPIAENIAMQMDLISSLCADNMKDSVTLLGLDTIVNEMESAIISCNNYYVARADERLARALADQMKDLRKQTDTAFKQLAEVISALFVVNSIVTKETEKVAELEAMIDGINAVLLEYTVAISRRGRGAKADVDPGTPLPDSENTETDSDEDEMPDEL